MMSIYGFIPAVTLFIGGVLALIYAPSLRLRTAIQHFAAGLTLSAVAAEIVPETVHDRLAATPGTAAGEHDSHIQTVGALARLELRRAEAISNWKTST